MKLPEKLWQAAFLLDLIAEINASSVYRAFWEALIFFIISTLIVFAIGICERIFGE